MWMTKVKHQQRHNLPRHDEAAAVFFFLAKTGQAPTNTGFAVYPKGKPLQKIPYTSPNVYPMIYPLLFPKADAGWRKTRQHTVQYRTAKQTSVTMLTARGANVRDCRDTKTALVIIKVAHLCCVLTVSALGVSDRLLFIRHVHVRECGLLQQLKRARTRGVPNAPRRSTLES